MDYTDEPLRSMDTAHLIGLVAEMSLDPDKTLTQDFSQRVQAIVRDRETPQSRESAHFTLTVCAARAGADAKAPRQIRLTGDAIDCPQRTKRDDEDGEAYYKSLPSIECHVNELIHLLTVGRFPVLKALVNALGDSEPVELQSMFDETRTYHRMAAPFTTMDNDEGSYETAYVQISRKPDPAEARQLMSQLSTACSKAEEESTSYGTNPTLDVRIN